MFAIQSGNKFVNPRWTWSEDEVYDITVSDTAKFFKTKAEADRTLRLITKFLDERIEHIENTIADTEADQARLSKSAAKYLAQIAELETQPYKEVHKRIRALEHKAATASNDARHSVATSYRRDLSRLAKIRSAGVAVVKVQQTVEAL